MSLRERALALLIECRDFPNSDMERDWRRRAAWTYLQMAMNKPPRNWTKTPPRTTVRIAP